MPSNALTTRPAHLARRASVALQMRRLALRERHEQGQGTVEYVALILLIGAILSAVVASGAGKHFNIADTIGKKLSSVIGSVGDGNK
ncbi:MAG: hypothetical protein JWM31_369 [Solirubrobacterales bacterium]|nr:hypothetical protein [Solirubrobacterales bacterium]